MDGRGTTVQALAIRDGEIVATGSDERIRALAGSDTRQIDLGGRRVLPGMVDASLRGVQMGSTECFSRSPRLDGVYTRAEALRTVADRAQRTPAGSWLAAIGRGWNVAQLDTPGMLTKAELDSLAPRASRLPAGRRVRGRAAERPRPPPARPGRRRPGRAARLHRSRDRAGDRAGERAGAARGPRGFRRSRPRRAGGLHARSSCASSTAAASPPGTTRGAAIPPRSPRCTAPANSARACG